MRKLPLLVAALAAAVVVALPATASTPASGGLSSRKAGVQWTGSSVVSNPAACTGPTDPTCDHFLLSIEPVKGNDVLVTIDVAATEDWDLEVYGPDGTLVAAGENLEAGVDEKAVIRAPVKGTYEVRIQPWLVTPGTAYKGTATFVKSARNQPPDQDPEKDCQELVPHAAAPVLTETPDDGKNVFLDVAVLADGVSPEDAAEVTAKAAASYAPFGVTLRAVSVTPVTFPADGKATDGRPRQTGVKMIELAKAHFGGARPAGADLVYAVTNKNLDDPGGVGEMLAGLADCIGGVEDPTRAFAVGEHYDDPQAIGPVVLWAESSVKVMGHELGHLMGAHHHYANCVEGITADDVSGDTGPCTLMSNAVDFQGRNFGSLEAAVVRAHASDYARP